MKKWSECIKRALRTFAEAAAAYLAAHIVLAVSTGGEDLSVMRTALMGLAVSSVAAGLAAVLNMPKKAAEGDNAASDGGAEGSAAESGRIEPDTADSAFGTAVGTGENIGGSVAVGERSEKDDFLHAVSDADKNASDAVPDTGSGDRSAAPDTEVGKNMPDGAGNKGIL